MIFFLYYNIKFFLNRKNYSKKVLDIKTKLNAQNHSKKKKPALDRDWWDSEFVFSSLNLSGLILSGSS